MVRVIYKHKHKVTPESEAAFIVAWERIRKEMCARAPGVLGAALFRDANDPTTFFTVSRWRSVEDWKAFWGRGVPDPQGDVASNTILVEVKSVWQDESDHS